MKRPSITSRGVALVVVLVLLAILFGLAITFLARVTVERSSASGFAASASTRQIADTAVNFVQGQIRTATSLGTGVAWASQPGMVRTYDSTGTMLHGYKLYSSEALVVPAADFAGSIASDVPPASWEADRAVWVDVNAPVTSGGVVNFPIVDPAAADSATPVEGFAIAAPPGASSRPGQLPLRWLYVLRDGSLAPGVGTGSTATVAAASAGNPIVGRIAFWTDDDTAKVNINTASEGTPWDTPRIDVQHEHDLADFQPAQGEYQRYPGHPAMTSLAPVLFASSATSTPLLTSAQRDAIYAITPRIGSGGSSGGSVKATADMRPGLDKDRLYASVDEMIFAASRAAQPTEASLDRAKLERAKFFLTATSRAPEVTLFNTPRVAIWPLDALSARRTTLDGLIAFCSSINGRPYAFTRSNPRSATEDFFGPGTAAERNRRLYAYLQYLSSRPIPGFGGNFLTKFGADRDQILTQIADYIRSTNVGDSTLPSSDRFSERGKVDARPNQAGLGQITPLRIGATQGFGRFPLITEVGIQFLCTADGGSGSAGGVLGSNVATNKSLGSPATLLGASQRRMEARIVYDAFTPGQGFPIFYPAITVRIRNLNAFSINGTNLGFPVDDYDWWDSYAPTNLWHGRAWGGVLSVRSATVDARIPARGVMPADAGITPYNRYPFVSAPITVPSSGTMSFSGGSITIDVYAGFFDNFASQTPVQTLTVTFPASASMPVPRLVDSTVSPKAVQSWWTFSRDGVMPGFGGRFRGASSNPSGSSNTYSTYGTSAPFREHDVVRTMVPEHSDFRHLIRPSPTVNFVPHPHYFSNYTLVHSFTESMGSVFQGGETHGSGYTAFAADRLAAGASYNVDTPDVAIYDARAALGDWDTGVSKASDGPYINKPDEGNNYASDPYFNIDNYEEPGPAFFSANRQVPSAGMFGSLPTGIEAGEAYRTLLLRPQPGHFGWDTAPRDHLLLDLFWMPVVEPYAISEPFSTAGKVNMNYEILPFRSFLSRSTAVNAILRGETILALPVTAATRYKRALGSSINNTYRRTVNIPETLKAFSEVFATDRLFRSPTEICEIPMVPTGFTSADMATFWSGTHRLTGDNVRERIYTNLLGRLTTKSNSFTVHVRAQALQKAPGTAPNQWVEGRDRVVGEYRGSTAIERYIHPNEPTIPDYASLSQPWAADTQDLGAFYKWRVLNTRQFAP